jgi:hypothetical protein
MGLCSQATQGSEQRFDGAREVQRSIQYRTEATRLANFPREWKGITAGQVVDPPGCSKLEQRGAGYRSRATAVIPHEDAATGEGGECSGEHFAPAEPPLAEAPRHHGNCSPLADYRNSVAQALPRGEIQLGAQREHLESFATGDLSPSQKQDPLTRLVKCYQ